jgi:geranylgeranyl pyrophosphate synthase
VNGPIRELLARGGRRWRAPIARLSFAVCGGIGEPPAALGLVELLHTASLVIDDIQDGSVERRGGPSVHAAHGIPVALGAANATYFGALALLRDALPPAMRLRAYDMLAREMLVAHLGQALDLGLTGQPPGSAPTEAHYRVLARAKTGALVRIAARLGAIAAGASERAEEAVAEWAGEIGLAYQIRDDLEDAAGSGGDAAAGRPSLPAIAAREIARAAADGRPRRPAAPDEAPDEAEESAKAVGVHCRDGARRALARALAALERLPPSAAREELARLSERLAGG